MELGLSKEIKAATFTTSSFSGDSNDCVAVAELTKGRRAVRDSKDPEGPVLVFTASEWDAFKRGVLNDEF
ncbi:DUF397 domain-containing protein [Nonomuraea sp. NPDC002799]